ncbi:hypothetical protein PF534_001289 [Salmonella enterica]|nr:hypothetical protein [Salmonella enterica]EAT5047019.1 hypothetical protein [Salmonella enterica subsp. enterica]EBH8351342.1 hypothetical protein [Salmonella enterica subsp. diarizonae serovar 61:l,[v],[z13]:1,5,[7]]ECF6855110.1 hypothetical protein [Salmonella enterica subsp. arizonae]EDW1771204.1 hypothetical protein [Salmonella enterica subsp. diarizonae]MBQ4986318.1 hypothetical protein [Salmonella enterica subsp. diarizonae serovar 61:l,v:1,5,7]MDW0122811.1 hypothetical protein [Salm
MSSTSEHEHVVASPIQSRDDDKTPNTTVFRSVPQNWTLTPQQRAFIDAFADDEPQK